MSKKASELWRKLSAQDRLHWDTEAAKEKERYNAEKELYKGPVSYLIFITICTASHVVFDKVQGARSRQNSDIFYFSEKQWLVPHKRAKKVSSTSINVLQIPVMLAIVCYLSNITLFAFSTGSYRTEKKCIGVPSLQCKEKERDQEDQSKSEDY